MDKEGCMGGIDEREKCVVEREDMIDEKKERGEAERRDERDEEGRKERGEEDEEVIEEVYCLCRQPQRGNEFMIACDLCNEWFHGACLGTCVLWRIYVLCGLCIPVHLCELETFAICFLILLYYPSPCLFLSLSLSLSLSLVSLFLSLS